MYIRFFYVFMAAALLLCAGCSSPSFHREKADKAAARIVEAAQHKALGKTEPFDVLPPADTLRRRLLLEQNLPMADAASLGSRDVTRISRWPDGRYGETEGLDLAPNGDADGITLSLVDALQVAARSSRQYQTQKEDVFRAALDLDLESAAFRSTWAGTLESLYSLDASGEQTVEGNENKAKLSAEKALKTGQSLAVNLGVDLVRLLTQGGASALGILADATLSIPLLRGSRRFVVSEPLTQAERDVIYAVYEFERFKKTFSVQVASDFLGVLLREDQMGNARDNYERLALSTRRARRLADAGRLPEMQVDQAQQDELRAKNRWVSAGMDYEKALDDFLVLLGLPPDAHVSLDEQELLRLSGSVGGVDTVPGSEALPDPDEAVRMALRNRLDLRVKIGAIEDAQREVAVAADQLRADMLLLGRARIGEQRSIGSADAADARLNADAGSYTATLLLDLPLNRTDERVVYRNRLIGFEAAVREVQELEDTIKAGVRDAVRSLAESRESLAIQTKAVEVAQRRLESTGMFLEAGRAEIRDLLEAEEAFVNAQNARSAAMVQVRINELALRRDMGILEVNEEGLWRESPTHDTESGQGDEDE